MKRKVEAALTHVACFLLGCFVTFLPARYIDYHSACWETAKTADDSNKQVEEMNNFLRSIIQSKEPDEWMKREPERRSPLDAPVVPLQQGTAGT